MQRLRRRIGKAPTNEPDNYLRVSTGCTIIVTSLVLLLNPLQAYWDPWSCLLGVGGFGMVMWGTAELLPQRLRVVAIAFRIVNLVCLTIMALGVV